jgi:F-type H+-transporting ATPase subunit delta
VVQTDVIHGYATALLQVAAAEDQVDRVVDELYRFAKAVDQNNELRAALTDIAIPLERKHAVVTELLGKKASPVTTNIVEFIVGQGRARELSEIVETLAEQAAHSRDKVLAEVRLPIAIDDELRGKLAKALSAATGKDVELKVVVDESVVGGVYAKVGDQVIDATVRRRLEDLKEQLAKTRG